MNARTPFLPVRRKELLSVANCIIMQDLYLIPLGRNKKPFWSLLPKVPDVQKDGTIIMKPSWRALLEQGPTTISDVEYWLDCGAAGLAAVCGNEFGNGLYPFDIDVPRFLDKWVTGEVEEFFKLIGAPIQRTGGGGYQIYVMIDGEVPRAKKLAWVPDPSQDSGRSISIETRGEGNYIVLPHSIHPDGTYYEPDGRFFGDFGCIPFITERERKFLEDSAKGTCEAPKSTYDIEREKKRRKREAEREAQRARRKAQGWRPLERGESVIDRVNEDFDIEDVLDDCGYSLLATGRWTHPGGKSGTIEVTSGNKSVHYSTNDPMCDGRPKTPFALLCYYKHDDDVKEAVKAMAEQLGMDYASQRREQREQKRRERRERREGQKQPQKPEPSQQQAAPTAPEAPAAPTLTACDPAIIFQLDINNEAGINYAREQEPIRCPHGQTSTGFLLVLKCSGGHVSTRSRIVPDQPDIGIDVIVEKPKTTFCEWIEGFSLADFPDGPPEAPKWVLDLVCQPEASKQQAANDKPNAPAAPAPKAPPAPPAPIFGERVPDGPLPEADFDIGWWVPEAAPLPPEPPIFDEYEPMFDDEPDFGINLANLGIEFTVSANDKESDLLVPQIGQANVIPDGMKVGQAFTLRELLRQASFRLGFTSPTGSGKTWLLLSLECVIIFVPYRNLARGIAAECRDVALVVGGEDIPTGFTKFACVYDCADKLRSFLHHNKDDYDAQFWSKVVVGIDESHQLVYSANFRRYAVMSVIWFAKSASRVLDLSATRLPLTPSFEESEVMRFEREIPHERHFFAGTIANTTKAIDHVLTVGQARSERPIVVLLQNSKNENELAKRQIGAFGWQAIHFNSDQKGVPEYEEMIFTQKVPEYCDVILSTVLWQDGHNLFSELFSEIEISYGGRPVTLIVVGRFGVVQIEQAASRIRDASRIETVLDMDFEAHEPTLELHGETIILTGDQKIDIPDIVAVLKDHAEKSLSAVASTVDAITKKYAGDALKDVRNELVKPFLFECGYKLVETERGEVLQLDELGIRHNAQIHFDNACWKSRKLMIDALNAVSQSIYHDCGMFDVKTALTEDQKAETKELRDQIKAERYAIQVQSLESYREAEDSQVVEDIENHDLLSDQRMIALCVKICMNARIVKESAIDAILDMSKKRKISRKNVREWIVRPAILMALRAGAANITISNEDAYRLLITRWKEGDIITKDDLIEWLTEHEGRVLVKPNEDLNKRLARARKLIKQAYGAVWSNGKFVVERLDPLVGVKFDDTFPQPQPKPKPAKSEPNDNDLVTRLRQLAASVPQSVESKLASQPLDWLEQVAQAVADRPTEIVMHFIGDDAIYVGCAHAAQLANLIGGEDPAKKELSKGEAKVLGILEKAGEPMGLGQIRKKTGNSKRRMSKDELQTALDLLISKKLVISIKTKRSIKYSLV